ncbi:CsgG/HfaB family protein, partial [Breznakiellaceae bacterium SP9]
MKNMRKMIFCIIPIVLIMGCGSAPAPMAPAPAVVPNSTPTVTPVVSSPGMDLDAAIKEAAAQMGESLPAMTEVALVSVASTSAQFSEYVISRLEAALVSGKKLVVVDRANLDKIREEQGFQLSGEVDDNSAKEIGKILGAGAIVTGSFINLGDVYGLSLKAINMKTAAIAVSYPADISKSTRIDTLLASGGGMGTARTTQTSQTSGNTTKASVGQAPAAEPAKVYNIGDKGPAGGIIFFDKLSDAGGWRYLEAAPAGTEQILPWGADGY